jgi:WD40 repeat protein
VVSGSDITARVWDATTGKKVARMTHDDEYVGHFSREGELVRIIHDAWVTSLAFSPDGKYVVSGSKDNTARVWESSTGNEVARLIHGDTVSSVAFSPDGRYVVSGSEDKTLRIWMWQPKDLISNACAYLPRNLTRAEWKQYIGDALPYEAVCPNLPIEPEITPTPRP